MDSFLFLLVSEIEIVMLLPRLPKWILYMAGDWDSYCAVSIRLFDPSHKSLASAHINRILWRLGKSVAFYEKYFMDASNCLGTQRVVRRAKKCG